MKDARQQFIMELKGMAMSGSITHVEHQKIYDVALAVKGEHDIQYYSNLLAKTIQQSEKV